MRPAMRSAIIVAVCAGAAAIPTLVVLGENPVGATAGTAALAPSTAFGENILFKSGVDSTFCIDEQSGSTQGRTVILSTCTTADTQRWALTHNANGTNSIVDSEGMCVDSTGRKAGDGVALEVFDCNLHTHQQVSYTATGLIQTKGGCFSVPGARCRQWRCCLAGHM